MLFERRCFVISKQTVVYFTVFYVPEVPSDCTILCTVVYFTVFHVPEVPSDCTILCTTLLWALLYSLNKNKTIKRGKS